ncbi:5'-nucleotidase C-terminal domain-containing protein [Pseudofulvibacter geojedonensis]|uniref:5'-nucleotidase C-terminal domain-containing protein n=1 Tax=Pseudofulvibacter geojedonensis TaxID=1123758 RepID=A0ABW3HZ06_9FLAO
MKIKQIVIIATFCFLISCKEEGKQKLYQIKANQEAIDSTITDNVKIDSFISPFKKRLNDELDSPLAYAKADLTKTDGELVSSLGNLMADICYLQAQPVFKKRTDKIIDFVLLNHGGIRAPIPKGPITARNAFEVMPFENELVVVELSGVKTKELLTYLATEKKAHPVGNMSLKISREKNVFSEVMINNQPFKENHNYYVLTSDYLQQGGDNMKFFANPVNLHKLDYKLRNALIDYFKNGDHISPNLNKRLQYAE